MWDKVRYSGIRVGNPPPPFLSNVGKNGKMLKIRGKTGNFGTFAAAPLPDSF
jgi:hypothetical protein